MPTPSRTTLTRRETAATAIEAARKEGRLLSQTILTDEARDALAALMSGGRKKRAVICEALVEMAKKNRE